MKANHFMVTHIYKLSHLKALTETHFILLFISKHSWAARWAFGGPGSLGFTGATMSDLNQMVAAQTNIVTLSEERLSCRALTYLLSVEHKQLHELSDYKSSLTPDNNTDFPEESSPSLWEPSAFGPLWRGLLRLLSSSCSHCRRAGLRFAAPLHHHRRRCRLAPGPTAGGKQGAGVSAFDWSVTFRRSQKCLG